MALGPKTTEFKKTLTKGKVTELLDAHVRGRNAIEHPRGDMMSKPLAERRQFAADAMQAGVEALQRLLDRGVLPHVLEPTDETRNRWGLLTLRALDEDGVHLEFYVASPTDLTRPWLWFATGTNPREVEPLFVDFDSVEASLATST
jgi:hypothetical protein